MSDDSFGPYRLVSLLGQGGMGEVWHAVDTRKDRAVALKLLGSWLGGDPDFARRFRRESSLAARLSGPHIVPIHDYGDIDGRLFIDMPLIDGTDLGVLLQRSGPLSAERAVEIIDQVAGALDTAHHAGMVHRDVKPSNVLVTSRHGRDHSYLIDFGISRAVDGTSISLSGSMIGTPAYMAPERFAGEGDHRSDIYALGCVLHEALTGQQPFTATNPLMFMNAHQNTAPPRPSSVRSDLPTGLDQVVSRALAKDPEQRFSTATALSAAARESLAHTSALPRAPARGTPGTPSRLAPASTTYAAPATAVAGSTTPPTRAPASVGRPRRTRTLVLAGTAAVLVTGGLVWALATSTSTPPQPTTSATATNQEPANQAAPSSPNPSSRITTAPFRLDTQITDLVGANLTPAVGESITALRADNSTQLFVVYVSSFGGADGQAWADQTARLSQLGDRDVLFAVATDDRAYGFSIDQLDLTDTQLDSIFANRVEPRLTESDWSGATIELAGALQE